jgi:hypothetical protein
MILFQGFSFIFQETAILCSKEVVHRAKDAAARSSKERYVLQGSYLCCRKRVSKDAAIVCILADGDVCARERPARLFSRSFLFMDIFASCGIYSNGL